MMILMTCKNTIFVAVLLLFGAAFCSADLLRPSSLIQYGDNIDRERLVLLEDRQVIRLTDKYSAQGTYVIRNSGEAYQATLGVLFYNIGGWPSPSEMGINFTVDGRQVQYTESRYLQRFVMGETDMRIASETTAVSTMWALIDVPFQENDTVTIQVQFQTSFSSQPLSDSNVSYNILAEPVPSTSYEVAAFANIDYWKEPTEFSLEIINESEMDSFIEEAWIKNMQFFHASDSGKNISMNNYLQNMQNTETDLIQIQRLSDNTVKIDFTEKFTDNYRRSFFIDFGYWEIGPGEYMKWSMGEFAFWDNNGNITPRELAPYELVFLTNSQLRIMRNVFYARHGFVFNSTDLQDMFNKLEGLYRPNPDFTEDMLTETDRANIATIQRLEALAGD